MSAERPPPERWVADSPSTADLSPADRARRRWGAVLIALGLVGILWGVFHLLGAVEGPEQRDFAHRQTYNEVKPQVQDALLGALLRSLAGLALALAGGRLRAPPRTRLK